MTSAALAAAMDYIARGYSVIPFYKGGKVPALAPGEIQTYRARAAHMRRVRQWFSDDGYNVGVITGYNWHLLVLDIDGNEGAQSIRGLPNPPTPRVLTPRRYHAWFHYDGPPRGTHIRAMPGIDILAGNWQVLAPPSVHPHGTAYGWQEMLSLSEMPLAPAPSWLRDLLQTTISDTSTAPSTTTEIIAPKDRHQPQGQQGILYSLPPGIAQSFQSIDALALAEVGRVTWTPAEIGELYCTPEIALRCAAMPEQLVGRSWHLGRIGRGFHCILPGHTDSDRVLSAAFYWDVTSTPHHAATGALVYRDFHREPVEGDYRHHDPDRFTCLSLPEVRASLAYGQARWLEDGETWVWQMRLLIEAGIVPPVPVKVRQLPPGVRLTVYWLYEGFRLLLGCKWLLKPGEPTTFAWRFAAAWCGLGERHIGEAMTWLLQHGYLRKVGTHKRVALFQLGRTATS
jgi:Bifunctional DNA primase/polymerase, N-terminal